MVREMSRTLIMEATELLMVCPLAWVSRWDGVLGVDASIVHVPFLDCLLHLEQPWKEMARPYSKLWKKMTTRTSGYLHSPARLPPSLLS